MILGEILDDLERAIKATGADLAYPADDVAEYTRATAAKLASAVGQPGFAEALVAARDSVLLFSASEIVEAADAADARFKGLIEGALLVAARFAAAKV